MAYIINYVGTATAAAGAAGTSTGTGGTLLDNSGGVASKGNDALTLTKPGGGIDPRRNTKITMPQVAANMQATQYFQFDFTANGENRHTLLYHKKVSGSVTFYDVTLGPGTINIDKCQGTVDGDVNPVSQCNNFSAPTGLSNIDQTNGVKYRHYIGIAPDGSGNVIFTLDCYTLANDGTPTLISHLLASDSSPLVVGVVGCHASTNATTVKYTRIEATGVETAAPGATAFTFTAPGTTTGQVGVASGNFTATPNAAYTGTITPSAGSGGGTFTPTSRTWSNEATGKTFTYTPASVGTKSITATASPALTAPAAVTYTATAHTPVTYLLSDLPGLGYAVSPVSVASGADLATTVGAAPDSTSEYNRFIAQLLPGDTLVWDRSLRFAGQIKLCPSGGGITLRKDTANGASRAVAYWTGTSQQPRFINPNPTADPTVVVDQNVTVRGLEFYFNQSGALHDDATNGWCVGGVAAGFKNLTTDSCTFQGAKTFTLHLVNTENYADIDGVMNLTGFTNGDGWHLNGRALNPSFTRSKAVNAGDDGWAFNADEPLPTGAPGTGTGDPLAINNLYAPPWMPNSAQNYGGNQSGIRMTDCRLEGSSYGLRLLATIGRHQISDFLCTNWTVVNFAATGTGNLVTMTPYGENGPNLSDIVFDGLDIHTLSSANTLQQLFHVGAEVAGNGLTVKNVIRRNLFCPLMHCISSVPKLTVDGYTCPSTTVGDWPQTGFPHISAVYGVGTLTLKNINVVRPETAGRAFQPFAMIAGGVTNVVADAITYKGGLNILSSPHPSTVTSAVVTNITGFDSWAGVRAFEWAGVTTTTGSQTASLNAVGATAWPTAGNDIVENWTGSGTPGTPWSALSGTISSFAKSSGRLLQTAAALLQATPPATNFVATGDFIASGTDKANLVMSAASSSSYNYAQWDFQNGNQVGSGVNVSSPTSIPGLPNNLSSAIPYRVGIAGTGLLSRWSVDGGTTWKTSVVNLVTAQPALFALGLTQKNSSSPSWGPVTLSEFTSAGYAVAAPTVTVQPSNQTITAGNPATISATATGATSLQAQRYVSNAWTNVSGATLTGNVGSYTSPNYTTGDNGALLRLVFANSGGTTPTNAATITVNTSGGTPPTIQTQPQNATVTAPASADFSATATGTAPITAQAETSNDSGNTWSAAGSGNTYSTGPTTTANNGLKVRFKFTNSGGTAYSNPATLTVNAGGGTAVYPSAGNVRSGVQYGPGGNDFTGTLTIPIAGQVLQGVQYGGGGNEYTGSLVASAYQSFDITLKSTALNKTKFFAAGREILSITIVAEGEHVPDILLSRPLILIFGPVGAQAPPAQTSTNHKTAAVRIENGNAVAEIFIGDSIGNNRLPQLSPTGSANGTQYQVWVFFDGESGEEELFFAAGVLTVFAV